MFRPELNPYKYLGTKEDPLKINIAGSQDWVGKHVDYVLLMSNRSIEQELRRASDSTRARDLFIPRHEIWRDCTAGRTTKLHRVLGYTGKLQQCSRSEQRIRRRDGILEKCGSTRVESEKLMTGCVVGIAYKNESKIAHLMDRAKLCKGNKTQRRGAHIRNPGGRLNTRSSIQISQLGPMIG